MTRVATGCAAKHRTAFSSRSGVKLTYLPFIVQAAVDALKEFPVVNASVDGDEHRLQARTSTSASRWRSTGA